MLEINSMSAKIVEAVNAFALCSNIISIEPYGNGRINDTFLVECQADVLPGKKYILQRINHLIFKEPEHLMSNILNVTVFLRKKLILNGGDPNREVLNVVMTSDGKSFYKDSIGSYWRVYDFIEDTIGLDKAGNPSAFYESAVAFGNFQRLLCDFPINLLYTTVKDFHNTRQKFEAFEKAVAADVCRRSPNATSEIEFALAHKKEASILLDMVDNGKLILKATHSDTMLNNILVDKKTLKCICIVDLDTVMPGLSITQFGDAIRYGACKGAEDEKDLDKVFLDLELFETYAKGYINGCGECISPTDIEMLPMAAKIMTFECGIRFLTDYLQGDTYFNTNYVSQNLDRCRTQFKLVRDMENKWDSMMSIVNKYYDF